VEAWVPALTEVMPTSIRVMGFSLAFSLSTALFGGVTLAISTYLIDLTGNKAAPGQGMSFAAGCSLVAALLLFRQRPSQTKPVQG
jgi:MFS transporter, MHS family, citrate/tricarballylate:H+ symporter